MVAFSTIFEAYTEITFVYNFAAPLKDSLSLEKT